MCIRDRSQAQRAIDLYNQSTSDGFKYGSQWTNKIIEQNQCLKDYLTSVSYTHLDVYKRQVCEVHLNDLEPREKEFDSSTALIRGVAAAFKARGYQIGGFTATMSSQVPKGSGLSSSASYEVMIGNILSNLFNEGRVSPVEIAQIGQYAENVYFGKPCGLMDQTASSCLLYTSYMHQRAHPRGHTLWVTTVPT